MSDSQQGMYARDIQMFPEPKPMQKVQKTKEEIFSESHFEWIKTERQGDISKFSYFVHENGVDYVVFQDGSRIREELVGDVVLMHQYPEEILGLPTAQPFESAVTQEIFSPTVYGNSSIIHKPVEIDPVVAILEKTKKKTEKITLTLNLKIPSPDLYGVIKENFENTDEILLQSIMDQIHDNVLREALKRELQVIDRKSVV